MRFNKRCLTVVLFTCCYCALVTFFWSASINGEFKPLDITRLGEVSNTNSSHFTVLLWTKYFEADWNTSASALAGCSVTNCRFTSNRDEKSTANAVLFHLYDLSVSDLPRNHPHGQKWILYNLEAPPNTEHYRHKLDLFEDHIDWVASYQANSDIIVPYGRVVPLDVHQRVHCNENGSNCEAFKKLSFDLLKPYAHKVKSIAWFVSNCHTPSKRESFVNKLMRHIDVDIYGKCGRYSCSRSTGEACFLAAAHQYKFYLSFENAICDDYVTEKLFNSLRYDIVPVVMGGANYSAILPPNSFVDALAFDGPEALAMYLKSIDDVQYVKFFDWKRHYRIDDSYCLLGEICKKLRNYHSSEYMRDSLLSKSSFYKWWFVESNCRSWKDSH